MSYIVYFPWMICHCFHSHHSKALLWNCVLPSGWASADPSNQPLVKLPSSEPAFFLCLCVVFLIFPYIHVFLFVFFFQNDIFVYFHLIADTETDQGSKIFYSPLHSANTAAAGTGAGGSQEPKAQSGYLT